MGLDFYGIAVRKSEIAQYGSANAFIDFISNDAHDALWKERELFYGRKCWELVYELGCDTHNECKTELTLEKWIDLQDKLAVIGPSLDRIWEAFYVEDEKYDDPQDKYLRNAFMRWYDLTFQDEEPRLGYGFSVGYMNTFWKSADKVLKYLEDPDWEVWMSASYQKGY